MRCYLTRLPDKKIKDNWARPRAGRIRASSCALDLPLLQSPPRGSSFIYSSFKLIQMSIDTFIPDLKGQKDTETWRGKTMLQEVLFTSIWGTASSWVHLKRSPNMCLLVTFRGYWWCQRNHSLRTVSQERSPREGRQPIVVIFMWSKLNFLDGEGIRKFCLSWINTPLRGHCKTEQLQHWNSLK